MKTNEEFRDYLVTSVFSKNLESKKSIVINCGGARSSKTFSLCQLMIFKLTHEQNIIISIVRKTLPSLRASVMRDFFDLLKSMNLYNEKNHNKTNNEYTFGNNLIEFFSVQDFERVKGRQRDYLWLNEANEFSYDDFHQLNMRTSKQTFIDFNPSDPYSYIFEKLYFDNDVEIIHSTILNNPFAPKRQKEEILKLKDSNPDLWKVYGLGEKAVLSNLVYTNWIIGDYDNSNTDVFYGLDFGFNHPTVLSESYFKDEIIYTKEVIYQSKLTNNELIDLLKLHVKKNCYIWADAAEPARIEEIKRAGFNIHQADKSVKDGIDFCKRYKIVIDKFSVNGIKEFKSYSYKEVNGKLVEEPVKFNDDFLDSARYGIYNYGKMFIKRDNNLIFKW